MGRLAKKGLEYFPMDIDMFQDIRIRKLIKYQGGASVAVYTLLLCLIYKDGYYIRWDNELPFIVSEVTGLDENRISEVIKCCISIGLFDKPLFDREKILTSRGIQQRYCNIKRLNKRLARIDEYRLIDEPAATPSSRKGTPHKRQAPAMSSANKKQKSDAKLGPEAPASNTEPPASSAAAPPPRSLKSINAEYLQRFFADDRKESLITLCRNFGSVNSDLAALRRLADEVIADWELSDASHSGFTDWSKHLIATMRIKFNDCRKSQPESSTGSPYAPVHESEDPDQAERLRFRRLVPSVGNEKIMMFAQYQALGLDRMTDAEVKTFCAEVLDGKHELPELGPPPISKHKK